MAEADGAARIPRVLAIAGSDPSGGAGIQADLKSIAALGGYGMAAIAALTAQNTTGVTAVHHPPAAFLRQQLDTVADDIEIDAVKIGMLGRAPIIEAVGDWLDERRPPHVVLDPVMVATSGARLLEPEAEAALRALIGRADLVTPNLPELAALCGEPVARDWPAALEQAARLADRHGVRVLVKGGHFAGATSPDALVAPGGTVREFDAPRIETRATHGTGCSLSSAVATRRAAIALAATGKGEGAAVDAAVDADSAAWATAIGDAKEWLTDAIRAGAALRVGHGAGPVDHEAHRRPVSPEECTAAWWRDCAEVRAAIDGLEFIRGLADGSLDRRIFLNYLRQDALYLRDYARVLARAASLAPSREEQVFWATCAAGCLTGEAQLHESLLAEAGAAGGAGGEGEPVESSGPAAAADETRHSTVTRAYLDHLAAAGPDYGTVVAAALPCFWIYRDVGERLAAHDRPAHPYHPWLGTYADPGFAAQTEQAIAWAGRAAARAGLDERRRMAAAFHTSARHELAFFAQRPDAAAPYRTRVTTRTG